MEKQVYIPDDFIAGSEPLVTARGIVAAGQTFPRLTPLMLKKTAEGVKETLLVKWDGTPGDAIGVSSGGVNAPAEDTLISYYKAGCLRISALHWPDSVTTSAAKYSAFMGCSLSVDDE